MGPFPENDIGVRILDDFFAVSRYPNAAEVAFLSARLNCTEAEIQEWCKCCSKRAMQASTNLSDTVAEERESSHASFVARAGAGRDSQVARLFRMRQQEIQMQTSRKKKPLNEASGVFVTRSMATCSDEVEVSRLSTILRGLR